MKITSPAFMEGEAIPETYTCTGRDTNPPLAISGVPAGARTLALIASDPDALGGTFYHWLIWNLPADVTELPASWQPPAGTGVGTNGFGKAAYGGPCPPSGIHHYHFTAYALDKSLSIRDGAGVGALQAAMSGHIVAQTEIVGTVSH